MLVEETTLKYHLGMTKLVQLMKPKEKPIGIGLHTQKLANMVVGKDGGKPSDEIGNQVYC
jgi:hypothetical protein